MLAADLGADFMTLFNDSDVTELFVNPLTSNVWVDSHSVGKRITSVRLGKNSVRSFLNRAADSEDTPITKQNPRIEATLPQPVFHGSRLTGVLPPAVHAPSFCLRKFDADIIPLETYVSGGVLSQYQSNVIQDALHRKKTIAVVGGTGSGKTTLAMTLLDVIARSYPKSSILTIEDTRELNIPNAKMWWPLTTYPGADYTDLIHMSLRLSPDRIVVGECRGPSIIALFEAFMSGHPGGVFTFHAHDVGQTLKRMLLACKRESDTDSHRHTIASAVDLIIILAKENGVRFVPQLAEVNGFDDREGYSLTWIPRAEGGTVEPHYYYRPPAARSARLAS